MNASNRKYEAKYILGDCTILRTYADGTCALAFVIEDNGKRDVVAVLLSRNEADDLLHDAMKVGIRIKEITDPARQPAQEA